MLLLLSLIVFHVVSGSGPIFFRQPPGSTTCTLQALSNIAQKKVDQFDPSGNGQPFTAVSVKLVSDAEQLDNIEWKGVNKFYGKSGSHGLYVNQAMIKYLLRCIGLQTHTSAHKLRPIGDGKDIHFVLNSENGMDMATFQDRFIEKNDFPILFKLQSSHHEYVHWTTLIKQKNGTFASIWYYLDSAYPIVDLSQPQTDNWDTSQKQFPMRIKKGPNDWDKIIAEKMKPDRILAQSSKILTSPEAVMEHLQGMVACKLDWDKNKKKTPIRNCMKKGTPLLNKIMILEALNVKEGSGLWQNENGYNQKTGIPTPNKYASTNAIPILEHLEPLFVFHQMRSLYALDYEKKRPQGLFRSGLWNAAAVLFLNGIFTDVSIKAFNPKGYYADEWAIAEKAHTLFKNPKFWTEEQTRQVRITEIRNWVKIYSDFGAVPVKKLFIKDTVNYVDQSSITFVDISELTVVLLTLLMTTFIFCFCCGVACIYNMDTIVEVCKSKEYNHQTQV